MPRISETAHITENGKRLELHYIDPLEDQVRTVHRVMRRVASAGTPVTYEGRKGYRAPLNMTRIVRSLTPDWDPARRETVARAVGQVFSRTHAAHCLHRHEPGSDRDPTWFVADELPEELVIISNHVAGRTASAATQAPGFKEGLFLRPGERRLRPEEVGENLPPGEVHVTQTQTRRGSRPTSTPEERAQRAAPLRATHEENQRRHRELAEQLYEFVATAPIPMTMPEIDKLFNHEYGTDWNSSTIRTVLRELTDAGRLESRKETSAERLVRGGGHPVKATGPQLFFMPGTSGVERTELPKGIEPLVPASAWGEVKRQERESLEHKVYTAMDVSRPAGRGSGAPRTVHMIARAADVSDNQAQEALNRLVAAGKVFYEPSQSKYTPMHRVRAATLAKAMHKLPEPTPQPQPDFALEADPTPDDRAARQAVTDAFTPGSRGELVKRILEDVATLADLDGGGEVAQLRAQVVAQAEENRKLTEQNRHLRAALAEG